MIVVCLKTNLFKKTKEVQFSKDIKHHFRIDWKGYYQVKIKSLIVWFRQRARLFKEEGKTQETIFDICSERTRWGQATPQMSY